MALPGFSTAQRSPPPSGTTEPLISAALRSWCDPGSCKSLPLGHCTSHSHSTECWDSGFTQGGGNAWKGHKLHIFIGAWEDIEWRGLRTGGTVSQEKGWKFYPLRFKSSLGKALENICWDRKGPSGADGRNWRSCPGFYVCPSSCSRSIF